MDRNGEEDLKTTLGHACSHCGGSNLGCKGNVGHSVYIGQDLGQLCVLFLCDKSIHDLIEIFHHIGHT